jgi:hypothetical protein
MPEMKLEAVILDQTDQSHMQYGKKAQEVLTKDFSHPDRYGQQISTKNRIGWSIVLIGNVRSFFGRRVIPEARLLCHFWHNLIR